MKRRAIVLALALAGCGKDAETTRESNPWPPLTNDPVITGRAATPADVDAGKAVFALQDAGKPIGQPMNIKVPQYAYHLEEGTKARTRCVIIQAEEARGQQLLGCKLLSDGSLLAGKFSEFELLGVNPPASKR